MDMDRAISAPKTFVFDRATIYRWTLIGIMGIALVLHLLGIGQDLPFMPGIDEPRFVTRAVRMAHTGDLNPHWFGNPGSTVIYPLAGLYALWKASGYAGARISGGDLQAVFGIAPGSFYLLARLLTVMFSIASIPFVYLIGRRVFNDRVGIIGAWVALLSPVTLSYEHGGPVIRIYELQDAE
jgi:4-amino-4-deoxy-L-arabinose transferase-like glycosyltransferase